MSTPSLTVSARLIHAPTSTHRIPRARSAQNGRTRRGRTNWSQSQSVHTLSPVAVRARSRLTFSSLYCHVHLNAMTGSSPRSQVGIGHPLRQPSPARIIHLDTLFDVRSMDDAPSRLLPSSSVPSSPHTPQTPQSPESGMVRSCSGASIPFFYDRQPRDDERATSIPGSISGVYCIVLHSARANEGNGRVSSGTWTRLEPTLVRTFQHLFRLSLVTQLREWIINREHRLYCILVGRELRTRLGTWRRGG